MRGNVFANAPSGVRVNENPHPSFEIIIPLMILMAFAIAYMVLKIGAMTQQSQQKGNTNTGPQNLAKSRGTTAIDRSPEVKDNFSKKTAAENANNIYQLAEFAYKEWSKEGYYGNYIKAINLYKEAAEKGHIIPPIFRTSA